MSEPSWNCTVQELAQATGGQVLSTVFHDFRRVGSDTRQPLNGQLFIALKGEQFDAHDFVDKAVAQKARVILVHEWREQWKPLLAQATFVQVADTLSGLQSLARFWRKKWNFKVLAITGSNGKTSTKEFTYDLLKDVIPALANKGSFNNHWGVPQSILQASPEHKVLILEMGMSHLEELNKLCAIAEPDVVACTTVGRGHIGELGSQAGIAQAKEEIYLSSPQALHVFNMDNEWTMRMQSRSQAQQIRFSAFRSDVDVHFRAQRLNWDGMDIVGHIRGIRGQTWVPVLGRQNTMNLMCAASLALAVGMRPEQIWKGLGTLHNSAWGRNQVVSLRNGARVLFDAYNSNPDSMTALLKNLYEIGSEGAKFLVMGDMRELGNFSDQAHEEMGERAGSIGFQGVWYVGENSKFFRQGMEKVVPTKNYFSTPHYDTEMARRFLQLISPGDLIAVKGSRAMKLEQIVESWPLATPLGKKL